MPELEVSVIVPTFNRVQSLRKTLVKLDAQTQPHDRFEVIVVDDGSTDETPEIEKEHFTFPLRYVRQANQGSAAARNRGAEQSRGEILIFIDDDILAEPEYIEGLVDEHRRQAKLVGMGSLFTHLNGDVTMFARTFAQTFAPPMNGLESSPAAFTDCTTNNLSVERQAFFEIGMMQDVAGDGPTWWGDIDFGYRAMRAGYQFRRSGRAVCFHDDYSIKNLDAFCRRVKKAAQVSVLLLQKYPELFDHLPMLVDKAPISLGKDPLPLVFDKLFHAVTAWHPVRGSLEHLVEWAESAAPDPRLLRPLYRWIMSSYIYEGFHLGLREYGWGKARL